MAGKLFTWVDIDSQLAEAAAEGQWSQWLLEVDAWWDALELTVRPGTEGEVVRDWLDSQFGLGSAAEHDAGLELTLDRPTAHAPSRYLCAWLKRPIPERPHAVQDSVSFFSVAAPG
ncbi:hypothetical protein [Streptomyces sp. NPDC017448]|uniref:hypothetical protein n=1 Tax=Streptomyces sp. NPDC017448 TaxID=3364996 RepID=UPI0037A830A5